MSGTPSDGAAPRVTVVLATYNGAKHLAEQLASLAAQTLPPDELVVSDDGSTDDTLAIVERFAESVVFDVRVHRQPTNLGPDQNFAAGISLATGDVVFCCDQDDRWQPDKIRTMTEVLQREPQVGLVLSDARVVDEVMEPTGTTLWQRFAFDDALRARVEDGDAFAVLARRMPVYGCTMAFRRAFADAYLPVPRGVTFDSWVGQVVAAVSRVRLVPDALIDYRQHAAQFTGFDGGSRLGRLRAMVARSDATAVRQELVRLDAMADRLSSLPDSAAVLRARGVTDDRLRLARRRLSARRTRVRRLPIIAGGVLSGEYSRGAQGLRSAAIDLLAPRER